MGKSRKSVKKKTERKRMAKSKRTSKKKPSKVRQHFEFLSYLSSIPPRRQKILIKGADRPLLESLSEICMNLLHHRLQLSKAQIDKLRPFERQTYQLSQRSHSLARKKRIVQKGGMLTALLSAVLPALISSVIGAASK